MMFREEAGQAAELDSYHREIHPGFGAGFGGFVVAHQAAVPHQPAESSFHHPAAGQHFEALHVIRALDDLDFQLAAAGADPLRKRRATVATVHPEQLQPGQPGQRALEQGFGSVALGGVSGRDQHAQHQAQCVHQQMALAAFDLFGGVVTHRAAVGVALDALAVQDGRRGAGALAVRLADGQASDVLHFDEPARPHSTASNGIAEHAGWLYFTLSDPQSDIWVVTVTGLKQ